MLDWKNYDKAANFTTTSYSHAYTTRDNENVVDESKYSLEEAKNGVEE